MLAAWRCSTTNRALARLTLAFIVVRPAAASADEHHSVVMIVDSAKAVAAMPLAHLVESHLRDLPVRFVVQSVSSLPPTMPERIRIASEISRASDAVAVFWCDVAAETTVFLYLAGQGAERVLTRRIEDDNEQGRAEAVAIIVRSATSAMLEGGEIDVRPPAARVPSPEEAAAPIEPDTEAPAAANVAIDVAYLYYAHSADHLVNHGLSLDFEVYLPGIWSLAGGYRVLGPLESHGETTTIRIRRHPMFVGVRVLFDLAELHLGLGLLLFLDIVTHETSDVTEDLAATADRRDVLFGVAPSVDAVVPLVGVLGVFASIGVEIPLNDRRYVAIDSSGTKEVLVDSWTIRPMLIAGLRVDLF